MGSAEDQTAYILVEQKHDSTRVIGLLKVGRKRLFLLDESGQPHELQPHCVLDFYVVEDRQRGGCGKKLFEFMLQTEKVEASNLAIDRPSEKLVSFMKKHYGLVNTIPQVSLFSDVLNVDKDILRSIITSSSPLSLRIIKQQQIVRRRRESRGFIWANYNTCRRNKIYKFRCQYLLLVLYKYSIIDENVF